MSRPQLGGRRPARLRPGWSPWQRRGQCGGGDPDGGAGLAGPRLPRPGPTRRPVAVRTPALKSSPAACLARL